MSLELDENCLVNFEYVEFGIIPGYRQMNITNTDKFRRHSRWPNSGPYAWWNISFDINHILNKVLTLNYC